MSTIITHAVVATALAPLAPRGVSRSRLAFALAVVSVFPDLDVVSFRLGIPYDHPLGHRGLSHSLVFALALAALVARFEFGTVAPESGTRWRLFLLLFAAAASHGVLDSLTDGGLGVGFLLPFSAQRFFAPIRPLPVSPIGVDSSMLRILRTEALYVWLPALGFMCTALFARRRKDWR